MEREILLKKIMFNFVRSQKAYVYYCNDRNYLQALRIFRANNEIYNLLTSNCDVWLQSLPIIDYLFHLEDWFEQFKILENTVCPKLEDVFIFKRIDTAMEYPKDIIEHFKRILL